MLDQKLEERDYQREAVEKVLQQFANGKKSVMLESPVGSGKTIMGLMIIRELQQRFPQLKVSWTASRKHILQQVEAINARWFQCSLNTVSVFASNPPAADLVVLDEAHHEATQSCLDFYEKSGNPLTLGLTATPLRTDRMRLAFETNVSCGNIAYFIQRGVLSPFYSYKLKDWHIPQVAKVFCEDPEMWGKTIVFFSRISECFEFQELLRNEGITCEVVTGSSNKDAQLEAFINGDVQVVANVSVLTEGFDLPELQSVFIRDASRLPTIQMAGRGLRKAAGKTHCKIVQSSDSAYAVEKIAEPRESFRYRNGKWLSCSGNTQAVIATCETTMAMLEKRKVEMPLYLKTSGRHFKWVTLKRSAM